MRNATEIRRQLKEEFDNWSPEEIAQYAYCRWVDEVSRLSGEEILDLLDTHEEEERT